MSDDKRLRFGRADFARGLAAACLALLLTGCFNAAALPSDENKPPKLTGSDRDTFSTLLSGVTPFSDDCGDPDETSNGVPGREFEPYLAVDPDDPEHLVATWQQDRYTGTLTGGSRSDLVASSFDGGATWTEPAVIAELTACSGGERHRASDPHVALGAGGVAWFTGMAITIESLQGAADWDADIMMAKSDDGGRSWPDAAVLVARDDGQQWHEWSTIQADPHRPGRAWVAWADHLSPDPGNPLVPVDVSVAFSSTVDGGATWSPPVTLPGNVPNVVEWPLHIAAIGKPNDRVLVVTYTEFTQRIVSGRVAEGAELFSVRSTDGGITWEEPVQIANRIGPAIQGRIISPVQTGRNDLLMASWINVGDEGAVTLMLAQSKDQGQSWSQEVVNVFDFPLPGDAEANFIGPAQARDGTRGVAWFVTGAPDGLVHVFLATDSGGGWSSREVESFGSDPPSPGDYFGMVGLEDAFGMVYMVGEVPAGHGPSNVVFTRAPSKTTS